MAGPGASSSVFVPVPTAWHQFWTDQEVGAIPITHDDVDQLGRNVTLRFASRIWDRHGAETANQMVSSESSYGEGQTETHLIGRSLGQLNHLSRCVLSRFQAIPSSSGDGWYTVDGQVDVPVGISNTKTVRTGQQQHPLLGKYVCTSQDMYTLRLVVFPHLPSHMDLTIKSIYCPGYVRKTDWMKKNRKSAAQILLQVPMPSTGGVIPQTPAVKYHYVTRHGVETQEVLETHPHPAGVPVTTSQSTVDDATARFSALVVNQTQSHIQVTKGISASSCADSKTFTNATP